MDQTFEKLNFVMETDEVRNAYASKSPREMFARISLLPRKSTATSLDQSTEDDNHGLTGMAGVKRGVEVSLHKMGFNHSEPIDWSIAQLPPKTELHKMLHYKISNFIDSDVKIKISNHEYRCHRLVLQAYSQYFIENTSPRIEISEDNVTKNAFTTIYEWMLHYGDDSFKLLRMDNILEMYMAAKYLMIEELITQCEAFIDCEDLMSEDRAFSLYLDARAIGNTYIMMNMVPRIQRFFLTLVASKEYLELSADEVCIILHSNFICIHCEMEVFMSAIRWLLWDWDSRRQYVAQLMSCVRFGLITPWQLVDIRRNPKNQEFLLITREPEVVAMIEDGLAFAIVNRSYESSNSEKIIENFGLHEPTPRNWAETGKVIEQKRYETYQEFLNHLSQYRKAHVLAKKGRGDRVMNSSESLREELEKTLQTFESPDLIMQNAGS